MKVQRPIFVQNCLEQFYDLGDEICTLRFGALTPGYSLMSRLRQLADDVSDKAVFRQSSSASKTSKFDILPMHTEKKSRIRMPKFLSLGLAIPGIFTK